MAQQIRQVMKRMDTYREIDKMLYTDHDWGVYKYRRVTKNVALELIKFSDNYPSNICLGWWINEDTINSNDLFNLNDITFCLYYYELNDKLYQEIEESKVLQDAWIDSDCYTLTNEEISNMKARTLETKQLLYELMNLDNMFKELVYNK